MPRITVIPCVQSATLDGGRRRPTLFRPLRRVVHNFVRERTASVTLVFQRSDVMPRMRWFRQVEPNTLPNAEIPDMITIEGKSFGNVILFNIQSWILANWKILSFINRMFTRTRRKERNFSYRLFSPSPANNNKINKIKINK